MKFWKNLVKILIAEVLKKLKLHISVPIKMDWQVGDTQSDPTEEHKIRLRRTQSVNRAEEITHEEKKRRNAQPDRP